MSVWVLRSAVHRLSFSLVKTRTMRKALNILVCLICCWNTAYTQQIKAGLSGGLPVGNASDVASFALNADLSYLFEISDSFRAGGSTGYSHSFADTIKVNGFTIEADDIQYIPLAGSLRLDVPSNFTLGLDVGYGIGVNKGNDGGFYFSPRVQYNIINPIDAVLAYRSLSIDGNAWDIISLGLVFRVY